MQKLKFGFVFLFVVSISFGQPQVIDKVIGIVGKYPILLSDLQNSMLEREKQDVNLSKCKAFEMLVFQKLLVAQADRDSVTVTDAEVDHELDQRMTYYIQQFGSAEKLEEFYGKRTNVIKDELRGDIQEQLIAQKMQGKITGDVKLTPAEVRKFYNSIPQDSLPLINSEVELQQIVKKPTFSAEAKLAAKEQLEEYRARVVKGEKMTTLARLYSEDPGSAKEGGFYGNVARGVMDPAFESAAFRLKQGEISNVFETAYGYHFIELVQRKGELLDLRHILVVPKMSNEDFYLSKLFLDSIYSNIKEGKITFEDAAKKYSDDAETKQNGGLMINRNTASTKFDNEDLSQTDPNLIVTLNAMQIGDISKPMQYMSPVDGKPGFRLLKLKNRIDPHKTNLKDDYQKLALLANSDYNKKQVKEWIKARSKITYIKLDPEYSCTFENQWTISN
ncbi:MAG: peptidylprolyl isomerase [Bacteroidota bacterium]|nr:peptidylprolyl isomerase [Bacteroidota bacterium]MDP3144618.1 peptidylprolyl isomerase [Bacteroidota bacterium]MDP3556557.1 peptidylprolyl isomerase [Bacteroidota bacterium]